VGGPGILRGNSWRLAGTPAGQWHESPREALRGRRALRTARARLPPESIFVRDILDEFVKVIAEQLVLGRIKPVTQTSELLD
jgi:hypothetical protein